MDDFSFEIKKHIGVIKTYTTGWTKELNIIDWNGNGARFDIRDWDKAHEHMSRGVTLSTEDAQTLLDLLKTEFENFSPK